MTQRKSKTTLFEVAAQLYKTRTLNDTQYIIRTTDNHIFQFYTPLSCIIGGEGNLDRCAQVRYYESKLSNGLRATKLGLYIKIWPRGHFTYYAPVNTLTELNEDQLNEFIIKNCL